MSFIGYSTGALAKADFQSALVMLENINVSAIELSALRDEELKPLIASLPDLPLDRNKYRYISIHAPSQLVTISETELVEQLKVVAELGWNIILHPDVIQDFRLWEQFGEYLCVENMDNRKKIGSTTSELRQIFDRLPDASLCFDIGHARQYDRTMIEAEWMLMEFGDRLKEIHISEVDAKGKHQRLSILSIRAFSRLASYIDPNIPVIIESPVSAKNDIVAEIESAQLALKTANTQTPLETV